jgi:YidC/Oxa1 family membrane protein insertase
VQNIFGFIIRPMEIGLVWLAVQLDNALHNPGVSTGLAIILFTIAVRLVLAPLLIVQLRNARRMQKLQPMIAEIRKKHGKDREAVSKATMALYKEHQVNPALGCFPTLLQFPILIGLFYALLHLGTTPTATNAAQVAKHPHLPLRYSCNNVIGNFNHWLNGCYVEKGWAAGADHVYSLFHSNFLWLHNGLGQPDPYLILPLLAGLTQWIQSRMMLTQSADPQQQMMNRMMNFLPLMIIFFATRYASGLSLYWVTSTTIGIAIQYRITGLGLLPSTLASIRDRLQGGLAPARAAAPSRPRQTSKAPSKPAKPVKETRPEPKPETNGLAEVDSATVQELDMNGKSGDSTSPPRPAARTARRPGNRPRGGKRGGRRG